MPDQTAHIAGRSAALDALYEWNLKPEAERSSRFDLVKEAAARAVAAAAPHIAAQALRDAAVDVAGQCSHPNGEHPTGYCDFQHIAGRLRGRADRLAGRPGSAAPKRTETADQRDRQLLAAALDERTKPWPREPATPTERPARYGVAGQPDIDPDDGRHLDCPAAHCGSWALHNPHGDCPGTRN